MEHLVLCTHFTLGPRSVSTFNAAQPRWRQRICGPSGTRGLPNTRLIPIRLRGGPSLWAAGDPPLHSELSGLAGKEATPGTPHSSGLLARAGHRLAYGPARAGWGAGCGHTPGVPEAEGPRPRPGSSLEARTPTVWLCVRPDGPVVWSAWPVWPVWLWPPGAVLDEGLPRGRLPLTCREGRRTLFPASPADVVRLLRRGALSGLGTGQEGETHSRVGGWQPGPCPQAESRLPWTWHRLKASRGGPGAGGAAASFV